MGTYVPAPLLDAQVEIAIAVCVPRLLHRPTQHHRISSVAGARHEDLGAGRSGLRTDLPE